MSFKRFMLTEAMLNEAVSVGQLKRLEKELRAVDLKGYELGITFTRHFIERVVERSKQDNFTIRDIQMILKGAIDIYGSTMNTLEGRKFAGHFVDAVNGLDIPFVIQPDTTKLFNMALLPKTVIFRGSERVKKGKFSDGQPVFKVR